MTRNSDVPVALNERARIAVANKADLFESIHLNAFNGSANGIETFKHSSSTASKEAKDILHKLIRDALNRFRRVTDRGTKSANYAVLRGTYKTMLAVLTESLFIDNKADNDLLRNPAVIDAIARAHAEGIALILKLTKKNTQVSSAPVCTDATVVYKTNTIKAFIEDGVTYAQMRQLADLVGATVGYDATTGATLNSKRIEGRLIDGHNYLPVRELAEKLGLNVGWDQANKRVTLS